MTRRSGTENREWRALLEELRTIAGGSVSRAAMLQKLADLEAAITSEIEAVNDARRRRIIGPRARVRAATYSVEDSPRGRALTERRPEAEARPYKVPLPHYRAVAAAVAATAEPQLFAAIKNQASRRLGEELPDYAARVSLRFWSATGLIRHEGARFTRLGTKGEFSRRVRDVWAQAERERITVEPS